MAASPTCRSFLCLTAGASHPSGLRRLSKRLLRYLFRHRLPRRYRRRSSCRCFSSCSGSNCACVYSCFCDGDPDMLVPGVDTHLHRLHAEAFRVQEPDRERAAAKDLRPALFQEPAYLFDVEGRHARPSVSVNCKDGHRAYLLPVTVVFKKRLTPSAASDNTQSVLSFTCGSCPARGGSTTPMLSGSFISAAHFP